MNDLYTFFHGLFEGLNAPANQYGVFLVYLAVLGIALALRTVTFLAYRSAMAAFRFDAKDLKTREDIKKLRHAALRRLAAEYIRVAEKDVTRIPTRALAERQVAGMSLAGWRYANIMLFVEGLENGLAPIGVVMALAFGEYALLYGTLAAGGFVLTRLASAFCNFRAARDAYADELVIYTEREVGRFFAADAGGAVRRLTAELTAALARQSAALKEALGGIGPSLADAVAAQLGTLSVAHQTAAQGWTDALGEAARQQEAVNAAAERMQTAGNSLHSASDLLAKHFHGYSNAMSEQLSALVSAVTALKDSNALTDRKQDAMLTQMKFIEENQRVLDTTVQNYEAALKDLAETLSDGLGAAIQLHARAAAQGVGEALGDAAARAQTGSGALLNQLTVLFDQLRASSADISDHLRSLHEKISGGGA